MPKASHAAINKNSVVPALCGQEPEEDKLTPHLFCSTAIIIYPSLKKMTAALGLLSAASLAILFEERVRSQRLPGHQKLPPRLLAQAGRVIEEVPAEGDKDNVLTTNFDVEEDVGMRPSSRRSPRGGSPC